MELFLKGKCANNPKYKTPQLNIENLVGVKDYNIIFTFCH